jgi:glycosyltransferase involved in cell wall biosynthesis
MSRITISLPCLGRPVRTKRSIQCILDQTVNGWEAFIMGDCCPDFQELIDSGYLESIKQEQLAKGNIIHYFNAEKRGGGFGYTLTNHAIQNASGKYLVFLANDDIITPDHFEHYLSEIENTDLHLVYYNSTLAPLKGDRDTKLVISGIGHCDIIVSVEAARSVQNHSDRYTHDWDFIKQIAEKRKHKKAVSKRATYKVMRLGSAPPIENID